jgi:hypothetical protein
MNMLSNIVAAAGIILSHVHPTKHTLKRNEDANAFPMTVTICNHDLNVKWKPDGKVILGESELNSVGTRPLLEIYRRTQLS